MLEWKTLQGELADVNSGFTPNLAASGAGGTAAWATSTSGDWLRFDKINMAGIDSVTFAHRGTSAGRIEIHAGLPDRPAGRERRRCTASGDWRATTSTRPPAAITDPGGTHDLYIVAAATGFDLDEFTFNGPGVTGNAAPNLTANASPLTGACR